jgi:IS30 family transposase
MKKTKTWRQLVQVDRDRIQSMERAGLLQVEIAEILEVNPSRISREFQNRRKIDGTYSATVAEHKAQVLRGNSKYQGMKIEQHQWLKKHIVSELKRGQSPDGIAGRMKEEKWLVRVSSDAIYRWLRSSFGQRYCKYLCTKRYRKKPHSKAPERQAIPNMVSIHNMPLDMGHVVEGDTMLSPKKVSKHAGALVGWRETKLLKGNKVKSLRAMHTTKVMKKIGNEYVIDAMVLDQGKENVEHAKFGMPTYFCDPASPRQKPFIESSIGLLRRWFWPKGTDLSKVSDEEFQEKLEIINNKYRKTLQYRSANEVSRECGIIKN